MPQIFQVLKCYKCLVFQVHQTKKSNKFACKMCGEKQSIKRHYGVGNGQECRLHVQKLNTIRGELHETSLTDEDLDNVEGTISSSNVEFPLKKDNKWKQFVQNEDYQPDEPNDEKMYLDNKEVVLEIPNKKFRRKIYKRHSKTAKDNELHEISNDILKDENKKVCDRKEPSLNTTESLNKINNNLILNTAYNIDVNSKEISVKEIKSKFVSPVPNQNSKWAIFENNLDNEHIETLDNNVKKKGFSGNINSNAKKPKIITDINYKETNLNIKNISEKDTLENTHKNSKWNNFVEPNNEIQNNEQGLVSSSYSEKNLHNIFLLCDDDEQIDTFLDI